MLCRHIKKIILISLCLALSACNREYRTVFWIKHPQDLNNVIERCSSMQVAKARANSECMQAAYAYQQLASLGPELARNPELFGQKIINAQVRLAKLKQQLNKAKPMDKAQLKTQIAAQEEFVAVLQAVTVAMGEG